jgi:hypothetical protein
LEYNSSRRAPLAKALAATAGQPTIINGALVGPDAQSALALDQDYINATGANRLTKLQNSPATGCVKLITLARLASGYNAATPAAAGSSQMFLSFVNQILICPLFTQIINDTLTPSFSGSWSTVIDQIASYYVGLAPNDLAAIRDSLAVVGHAASSNPATNQTYNVFAQATLSAASEIDVFMYFTYVQMRTTVHHGGKHEPDTVSNQANMTLYRAKLRFNSAAWPEQAAQVEQKSNESLHGWLNSVSTPKGNVAPGWHPASL